MTDHRLWLETDPDRHISVYETPNGHEPIAVQSDDGMYAITQHGTTRGWTISDDGRTLLSPDTPNNSPGT